MSESKPARLRPKTPRGAFNRLPPSLSARQTRQQTLTQIDFVSVLTPPDDVDLDYLDDIQARPKKRRRTLHDGAPSPVARPREEGREGATVQSSPAVSQAIKAELPRTPRHTRRSEVPSSQSPPDSLSPVKREPVRSPLSDVSGNTWRPASTRKGVAGRNPKLEIEGGLSRENKDRQLVSKLKLSRGPSAAAVRRSPRRIRRLVIQDSEAESDCSSSGEEEADRGPSHATRAVAATYAFGPETQAVVDSLELTPEDLALQDELLQPAGLPHPGRDLPRSSPQHSQVAASRQLEDALLQSTQSAPQLPVPPTSTTRFSQATTVSGPPSSHPPRSTQSQPGSDGLVGCLRHSQLLPASLMDSLLPLPPSLPSQSQELDLSQTQSSTIAEDVELRRR